MPDFYFLGSLDQYWKAIYAEYIRLAAILGDEPFSIAVSGELPFPISKYKPEISDAIWIQFADRKYVEFSGLQGEVADQPLRLKVYGDCIVSVKAATILGMEQVSLDVNVYGDALKKSDGSVYARWLEIHDAWVEKGWLVNIHARNIELAQLGKKNEKPVKPDLGSRLDLWFDYYHAMNDAGFEYTFDNMAKDCSLTAGYLMNKHSNYKRERGLE